MAAPRASELATLTPPVPIELAEFADSGISVAVAAANTRLMPDCVRGVGSRVHTDRRHITVYLPVSTAVRARACLRLGGWIAVALSHPENHRAIQLKGIVVALRAANEDDRAHIERSFERFVERVARAGVPKATARRVVRWPCWALDAEIREVFLQTPGPRAGCRLSTDGR